MENEKCLCKAFRNEGTPALRCLSERRTHLCVGGMTQTNGECRSRKWRPGSGYRLKQIPGKWADLTTWLSRV